MLNHSYRQITWHLKVEKTPSIISWKHSQFPLIKKSYCLFNFALSHINNKLCKQRSNSTSKLFIGMRVIWGY